MCSFLKGRKLWLYATGHHQPLIQKEEESADAFTIRLEDLNGINHKIIIWLRNTSTSSVSLKFWGYKTTKDV